jgi:hypothetical protein
VTAQAIAPELALPTISAFIASASPESVISQSSQLGAAFTSNNA